MFGEFALYVGVKVVGFICDDQLFLKPTPEGLAVLADNDLDPGYAPAYPGSKDYLLIDIDSSEILCDLVRATADALPRRSPGNGDVRRTTLKNKWDMPSRVRGKTVI